MIVFHHLTLTHWNHHCCSPKYLEVVCKLYGSIMLWGCFCATSLGRFVKDKMNTSKYREILMEKLPPSASELCCRTSTWDVKLKLHRMKNNVYLFRSHIRVQNSDQIRRCGRTSATILDATLHSLRNYAKTYQKTKNIVFNYIYIYKVVIDQLHP